MSLISGQIPILDLQLWQGNVTERQILAEQLYHACHEVGFLYLKHHGISQPLIDRMFEAARQFFALPATVKHQLTSFEPVDANFEGLYVGVGEEVLDPDNPLVDLKEGFDVFHKDNYLSRWLKAAQPISYAARSATFQQVEQAEFAATALEFFAACSTATQQILQVFALALQMPESFFVKRFGQSNDLRLNYYPSLEQPPPTGQFRFSEHTDYGGITLLFQDQVGGLEIRTLAGEWIAAPPVPGTIGINLGDLMQQWTNDLFHSTWHRVVMPHGINCPPRYSLSFFSEPNPDAEVACLPSCTSERPAQYQPVLAGDYLTGRVRAALEAARQYA